MSDEIDPKLKATTRKEIDFNKTGLQIQYAQGKIMKIKGKSTKTST